MRLEIEALRTFVTIVDAGSHTRAGERLNLSQSAVSWKLKRLEDRIGRPLLAKDGRTLRLTDEGDVLLGHAREVLAAHDSAIAALAARDLRGEIRLGVTEELVTRGLARLAGGFARSYPKVRLSLRVDQSRVLDAALNAGEIDLAILQTCADDVLDEDVVLNREPLAWVAARPAVAAQDPLPLVVFGPDCFYRPIALTALAGVGRNTHIAVSAPTLAGVRAAIEAGLGIGILVRTAVPHAHWITAMGADFPALPDVAHVLRGDRCRSSAIRGLVDAILKEPLTGPHAHGATARMEGGEPVLTYALT
ncbi:LysR substrate-binding domain-containing protein [Rhodospirillaceae bacterium SYSU D60014]|uniref:LysR substrate-binding domain-containing protein n=1 Tax=Virgifigura deserti TaxID=2268457 RepID=UPI000E673E65